ncbi:ABC transporter permease [Lacibacterium aquatile]|uniref:ABC transporter permease n=1 Tax=Lacibacterium aquatile TaxID=1168082 RepID=A0ABW5DTH6_9PROT
MTDTGIAKAANPVNRLEVFRAVDGVWEVRAVGRWTVEAPLPDHQEIIQAMEDRPGVGVRLCSQGVDVWDSSLVAVLMRIADAARAGGRTLDVSLLPNGVQRLLGLALAVPERSGTERKPKKTGLFTGTGVAVLKRWRSFNDLVAFVGELIIAVGAFFAGTARFRSEDFWLAVEASGARALPIVTIIALLIGMIFAFVGAVQLRQFGADIYVANLVAVAMSREMGAVMTAIVLAGRTGAAFAAHISAMQGNEEVDALTSLGLSPMQFLVVPRVMALVLMMPFLTLYADLMGILGGLIVAAGMLNVTMVGYITQTTLAIGPTDVAIGLVKSLFFGALVAMAGCRAGMRSGRSAAAVGDATTKAVVSGILYIIICDAIFAVLLQRLGI